MIASEDDLVFYLEYRDPADSFECLSCFVDDKDVEVDVVELTRSSSARERTSVPRITDTQCAHP